MNKERQILIVACFFVLLACIATFFAYRLFPPGETQIGFFWLSGLLALLGLYLLIKR